VTSWLKRFAGLGGPPGRPVKSSFDVAQSRQCRVTALQIRTIQAFKAPQGPVSPYSLLTTRYSLLLYTSNSTNTGQWSESMD